MRILIVDDNAAMRKVLATVFASAGHEVIGAYPDGHGLEERIRQASPDLLCLDYNLPGRDGGIAADRRGQSANLGGHGDRLYRQGSGGAGRRAGRCRLYCQTTAAGLCRDLHAQVAG